MWNVVCQQQQQQKLIPRVACFCAGLIMLHGLASSSRVMTAHVSKSQLLLFLNMYALRDVLPCFSHWGFSGEHDAH
jgi:hypothetical protein